MKRMISFLLLLTAVLSCSACTGEPSTQPSFFYLRTEDTIAYGREDALVVPVPRDIPPDGDLEKLLQRYLNGPGEENLRNPFPKGTYLLSILTQDDTLVLVVSREFSTLDGIQLTLAGVCLAATCNDLTGYQKLQVRSGENIYDFDLNDFAFADSGGGK